MPSIDVIRENPDGSADRVLERIDEMRARGIVFDGDDTGGDPADYPWFEEALSTCVEARAATSDVPGVVSDHRYMHRAHLADARRVCAATLRRSADPHPP